MTVGHEMTFMISCVDSVCVGNVWCGGCGGCGGCAS